VGILFYHSEKILKFDWELPIVGQGLIGQKKVV
jgi:hypothetical protein